MGPGGGPEGMDIVSEFTKWIDVDVTGAVLLETPSPAQEAAASKDTTPSSPLAINVSLPNVGGAPGTMISIPVSVGDMTGQGVRSYDMQVSFNPAVLQPGVPIFTSLGTLSSGMTVAANASNAGHMIISAFQANDLSGAGTLILLNFTVVGSQG